MAEQVYELVQFRPTEVQWQLSEEERKSHIEKMQKAREEAGARLLALFGTYSSE